MAQTHSLPIHIRKDPWEVTGRTEHVMKKVVWEEEMRMPAPAKWQHVSLESWKQPKKLGRQMSDGDAEKVFQDLYPFVPGEHMLASHSKKKSQSLPRVLSPESLNFTEIPILLHDGNFPGIPKVPPYPPSCPPPLEPTRNPEKAGSSGPFPRPKFGKPLKPPSYGSHPQSRSGEDGSFQDRQHTESHSSYLTRSHDPRHELGVLDSGLEPPVYVPPPSYRSPPQHIPNPYLEDPVPSHVNSQGPQQLLPETPGASSPLPSGSLATSHLDAVLGSPPRGVPPHPLSAAATGGSVQYIPFDDPRIRHIKLAQPPDLYEEAKLDDRAYSSGPITTQQLAHGKRQCDNALSPPQGLISQSGNERGRALADSSPRWLHGPMDIEHGSFSGHTDQPVVRGPPTDIRDSHLNQVGHTPFPYPQSESTCHTHTKLRKFETGIQSKKSSKKKNETIFCLVSIPVKSDSHLPDTDRNNNDLKPSTDKMHGPGKSTALEEQSLLSMSSTDLELQALMGNMAWRREFPKQDLEEPEDELTNNLRFIHLTKPRALQSSGSWPSQQYRDQQTQTSLPEDSTSSQLLPATKPGGRSNAGLTPKCPDSTTSKAHMHTALASSDQKQKPSVPHLRGQMSLSPSHNSAFSRTSSAINQAPVPKGGSAKSGVDVSGHGASPEPKPEVVKGEPTAGLCNSTQLFGQFLLKPVSRRPWDLISQLESFNKELQEEEESHDARGGGSSEDSGEERQQDCADSRPSAWGCGETSQGRRVEQHSTAQVPEDPGLQTRRPRSMSECWHEEPKPGHTCASPGSPGYPQAEDRRGNPVQHADGSQMAEQQSQEVVNGVCERAVSPGLLNRKVSSRPSDTKAVPPSYLKELKESEKLNKLSDALGSVQLGGEMPPKVDNGEERDTEVPLSLVNKYQGLSVPDLRSLWLTLGQEQRAFKSDEPLGVVSVMEVPPNESLQERAERILGIEVAVESLLPGARRGGQSQHPEPNASACSPESPRKDSSPSSIPSGGPSVTTNTFYGRRKCGWTESPLFVGERAPQAPMCSGKDGFPVSQATSPESLLSPSEPKSFEEKDEETKPPVKSTLFHFTEKTPCVMGSEKRLRSPSKVIESLQEKLVSPPRKADPDRLKRMWEVSTLSRMRCLSAARSADSMVELEHLKASRGQACQPGALVSLSSEDQAWWTGHSPSISQDITSPEENGHPETPKEKTVDQDFWCPGEELGQRAGVWC
uniref:Junctional cadherin 5 associated n=1 Tax=Nannospalax galili TaxID=1026970 RepID=A0A8C6R333_NANGA